MSTSRRRNGKPASCEPCRRDKVRCDHALPVCTRCRDRGVSMRCYYHPAPLTRAKGRRIFPLAEGVPFDRPPSARNPHPTETSLNPDVSNAGQESSSGRIARTQPLLSGYFGPTSFVSPLTEDVDLGQGLGLEIESAQRVLPPYWVHKISEVLLTLNDFPAVEALIRDYYALSQSAIIAAPFVLNSLGPVKSMCKENIADRNLTDFTSSLTVSIIQNTSEIFEVPSATQGRDFHTLFTGPAIRLEIIGLLCALAGRARYLGLASDRFDGGRTSRSQYAHKMLAASEAALHICKILTPLNDLTVWLVHEILLLSDIVHGDSSPACWKRLGELSTDIFALGLHRDSKTSSGVPEFLLEARRRQFAAAYQLDKSIATFLGRPPRLPWRYADCRMPLDISDEALATDKTILDYTRDCIDENGWNIHGVVQRSSWIRVRFIISTFRDEILEVSLQNVTPEMEIMLKNISQRCHLAWDSLPGWLRYSPQCWDQNLHVAVCLMMIISYLAYLYNDFLIQRLIAGKNNPRGNTALLSVSADILSTVLSLGIQREQMIDLRPDFAWTVLLYGFPSASLLIKALQHQKRTGEPFLYEGSRSALIRNLSVFISHLESIVRPDNANYALFQRASQLFSRIIDEILEPQSILPDSNLDSSAFDFDPMIEVDGLDFFNNMDFGVAFNQWLF
ncbi:Zn(2)-C6 fungal-type DNA-binding domain [Penicillium roqueforti FM164]|uniref:Zn(2)-C6 fungal-type DNA-binding domain n=1 Tax=Penicillium roqueforti (strain FM164) TaxID=1365484 RepID=W6QRK0_PENRF|nr:Zn(2)-C6 fungal-type DNA-binding domain [Penicillium roqueforti FM164]